MTNPAERVEEALDSTRLICMADWLEADREHGDLRDGDSWGPWTWNETALALEYTGPPHQAAPYRVDVESIFEAENPDAETWDWVRHVAAKRWKPPALRCLVLALKAVLGRSRASS